MNNQEIVYVEQHKVYCEGQSSALGHPRVYLEIKEAEITCPYCSKIFRIKNNETN